MMEENERYDAVVIGAGNGGLIAANTLAKAGKKVLLVERHNAPGGFATSFKRGRFEFEASLHEMCDFGDERKHGDTYRLFKELGILDRVKFAKVPEAFRVISLSTGEDYTMPFGVPEFIDQMERYVPGSRKSVQTFFDLGAEISAATKYLNASRGHPDTKVLMKKYPNFMRVAAYSVDTVLKAIKMPKKAQEILDTYWTYLGAPTDRLSFIHYCIMVYLYVGLAAYIPTGRSHSMSSAFLSVFEENGGTAWLGDGVRRILIEGGRVSGVVLESGKKILTDHIVSNAMPHSVYGHMVDSKDVPSDTLRLANRRELSGRGFSIFLGLNRSPDELGLKNYSYFIYNGFDSAAEYDRMKSLDNFSQVTVCLNRALPDCSPKGTTILYFTSLYFSDCFDKAVNKENYFDLKDRLAEGFIKTFEKATKTSIRPYIEEIEVGTPLTYAHYTDSPDGAIYGYLTADLDNMMPRLMRMYNEPDIPGLRFCGGHAARSSGYNSAYLSGELAGKLTLGDMKKED